MIAQTRWIGGSYEAACRITPSTASQILAAIKVRPGSTVGTIADMTGINISTVKNSLPRMEKRGEARKLLSTRYLQRGINLDLYLGFVALLLAHQLRLKLVNLILRVKRLPAFAWGVAVHVLDDALTVAVAVQAWFHGLSPSGGIGPYQRSPSPLKYGLRGIKILWQVKR